MKEIQKYFMVNPVLCKCGHYVDAENDIYFGNFDECFECHKGVV